MTDQTTPAPQAVTITRFINRVDRQLDTVYRFVGYVCGSLLLLLAIYITYQVIVRKLDGPTLGNSETVGGYILAFAGTWAFSYSLRTGSHVRIDVLLPLFSRVHPYLRSAADWLALGSVGFFGTICAFYSWRQVLQSYCVRNAADVPSSGVDRLVMTILGRDNPTKLASACEPAYDNTYLFGEFLPEVWVPQIIVAVGFSMLAFTSVQWMASMLTRGILEVMYKRAGGDPADLVPAGEALQETSSVV